MWLEKLEPNLTFVQIIYHTQGKNFNSVNISISKIALLQPKMKRSKSLCRSQVQRDSCLAEHVRHHLSTMFLLLFSGQRMIHCQFTLLVLGRFLLANEMLVKLIQTAQSRKRQNGLDSGKGQVGCRWLTEILHVCYV